MKRASCILLLLACGLAACQGGDASPVILTLNGRDIRRAEFERFLALKMGEFTRAELTDQLRSQMLDEYIRRRLVLDDAARAGLTISDEEIAQAAKDSPQRKSTASSADTRQELADDLLLEKYYRQVALRDVRVSPEEAQKYFEENQGRLLSRPAFYVREIRVSTRERAEALRAEIVAGKLDFAAAARQHSEAPNAEAGGLARYDEGQLPAVLEKPIARLTPGSVSEVVQSGFGFHLFKLERRIQPAPPDGRRAQLDDRRAQLVEELVARRNQQALDEALARLLNRAHIEIHDDALGFTYTGQIRHN